MIINRVIDNAAVAAASLTRARSAPPASRRLAPRRVDRRRRRRPCSACDASTRRTQPGVGRVGERRRGARARLPRHVPRGRLLAPGRQHPADPRGRPARRRRRARALVRGIATGYEIQIDLVRAICLHKHKIDHVAHLGPSAAAGIGTLLGLPAETIYQAVGQALHTTTATRQSRKGEISTWKAHAPAFAGKMAVEAVDRAMRGETSPSPIYEGEDGVIAWLLDGPDAALRRAAARAPARPSAASSTRYTKEHSAEYQAQAWIDLARKLHGEHPDLADPGNVESIVLHTSPPHALRDRLRRERPAEVRPDGVARDARPLDPVHLRRRAAGRRPGTTSTPTPPERAARPDTVALWHKITTAEDAEWTRRYHSDDPAEKAFGGRVVITLTDGGRSSTRSPSPTRTRSARVRSPATTTSASSARLAEPVLGEDEIERFLDARPAPARAECRPKRCGSSRSSPSPACWPAADPALREGLF